MNKIEDLKNAVIAGKRKDVERLIHEVIAEGIPPKTIVDDGLVAAMAVVGEKFKNNEIFVPEMLVAGRAMKSALVILEPLLVQAGIKPKYKALIGTVEGDLHDIGKNLVAMMLKGANIEMIDLGTNVPASKFMEAAEQHKPHLILLSALLTTTMPAMKATVEAVRNSSFKNVKVMVGGAPITQTFANEIHADGYSEDAAEAVDVALALLNPA